MKLLSRFLPIVCFGAALCAQDARPPVGVVDAPTVKVLRGLTVPEFEAEMQMMNVALGVPCGFCHARGNFASDENPRKATARRMLEMTKAIDGQFFADYKIRRANQSWGASPASRVIRANSVRRKRDHCNRGAANEKGRHCVPALLTTMNVS